MPHKGFTLVELMVTIAILGIMAALAFPSMRDFVAKSRVTNRAEQTANLFRFAKGEAIRLNVPVVVCGVTIRTDGRSSGVCNDANINSGLMAFADKNQDGVYDSKVDIELRTVNINGNNTNAQVKIETTGCPVTQNCTNSTIPTKQFVFLPNGLFGVKKTTATTRADFLTNTEIGTLFVRLNIANAGGITYSRMLILTPTGNAALCPNDPAKFQSFEQNTTINERICTL